MPDLDALIRVKLDGPIFDDVYAEREYELLADTLRAVLKIHKPFTDEYMARYGGVWALPTCAVCYTAPDDGGSVLYPCDTVHAIVEALGIEV